jgi:hypothetical protein
MKRAVLTALAVLIASLLGARSATAATYTVDVCTGGNGTGVNNLFERVGPDQDACFSGRGLAAATRAGAPGLSSSGWQVAAPAGTSIAGFAMQYRAEWIGSGFGAAVDDGTSWLAGQCLAGLPCGWLSSVPAFAAYGWVALNRTGLARNTLRLITSCTSAGGCPSGSATAWFSDIHVTFDDPSPPTVAYTGGELVNAPWQRGAASVAYSATDNSGIRRTRLWLDGAPKDDQPRTCDYTRALPCSGASGTRTVDTSALADGMHTFAIEARDATDVNAGKPKERAFFVDNHAPVAPVVSVDGGEAPRSTRRWTLRWPNPIGQIAPVARAHYRVCPVAGGACWTGSAGVPGGEQATIDGDFGITTAGEYSATVWLEDAAGNADAAVASAPVRLRYDGGVPGRAQPSGPGRWLGAAEATTHRVPIAMAPGAFVPASGVAGYAVTHDGSAPGTAITLSGAQGTYGPPAGGWPAGTVRVRARAISGSGQAATEIGETTLRVDRLAPSLGAEGRGAPADWQPGPVDVRLTATDAPGGSGMGAAEDGDPVEAGGHVAYSLDGAALVKVRGDEAVVRVAGNGRHSLAYRAYDVAGNVSAERTLTVSVGDPADAPWPPPLGFWAINHAPASTFTAAAHFAASCPAAAVLTPVRDTYVDQSQPDAAFGSASSLVVRSGAGANARALLGFALPAAGGCVVDSALLRLHAAAGGAGGRTLAARRLASSWSAADTTWSTRPGASGDAATVPGAAGWVELDVTEQVRGIYRHGDDGLVVRDATEGSTPAAGQAFSSSEGQAQLRPQLVVSFR